MRIQSPTHRKHARIEIIPLIDIMFFLLASFMMVSLDMTKIENIRVNVPSATQVQNDFGADMVHIAVDKSREVLGGKTADRAARFVHAVDRTGSIRMRNCPCTSAAMRTRTTATWWRCSISCAGREFRRSLSPSPPKPTPGSPGAGG